MDTEDSTDGMLPSARQLIRAVGRAVPAIKEGYVELVRDLASDLQAMGRELRLRQRVCRGVRPSRVSWN